MPLDTGGVTNLNYRADGDRDPSITDIHMPDLNTGPDIGAALKTAREFQGLTLQDVADATRIRRAYLAAIEDMRIDELPSRPFTIGYIRAYAKALGLDGEAAVDRFKAEDPVAEEPLRAPVGVRREGDPRLTTILAGGTLIIAAIILWNVAQRAMGEQAPPPPTASDAGILSQSATPGGPVTLGAPLPAPVESTTPTPYVTPGLDAASAAGGSADAAAAARLVPPTPEEIEAAQAEAPKLPTTFVAAGPVYGAPASGSVVTLQARKPVSLIIRGADGTVYFAKQLAAGEAYRAPMLRGLVVDASEPGVVQVFAAGQSRGLLAAPVMSISKLAE